MPETQHQPAARSNRRSLLPFALAAILAAIVVHYGTRWGPWTYSDGVGYIVSARNLLAGPGLGLVKPSGEFEPLVSHPPLFSLLIAALGRVGMDLVEAARWINLLAYSAFVGGVGWSVRRLSDSEAAGLAASALLIVTTDVLLIGLSAMAEPLFLCAGFLGLLLLALHLREERSWQLLAGSALIGLSLLARYPAVIFWATAALGALLLGGPGFIQRIKRAVVTALALLPTALFLGISALNPQAGVARALSAGRSPFSAFIQFSRAVASVYWRWKPVPPEEVTRLFFPAGFASWLPLLLAALFFGSLGALILAVTLSWRDKTLPSWTSPSIRAVALLLLFQVLYFVFFAGSYVLTYPTPDVDERTLLPLLVAGELTLLFLGYELAASRSRTWSGAAAFGLLAAALVGYGILSLDTVRGLHQTGSGYTSRAWRRSRTLEVVRGLPQEIPLISNAPEAILLYTDRYPHAYVERSADGNLEEQHANQGELLASGAALILVDLGAGSGGEADVNCEDFGAAPYKLATYHADSVGAVCFHPDHLPASTP